MKPIVNAIVLLLAISSSHIDLINCQTTNSVSLSVQNTNGFPAISYFGISKF